MRASVLLAAALAATGPVGAASDTGEAHTYLCSGGAVLRVVYIAPAEAEGYAVVDWAGRLIPMRQVRSASGVWYVAFDEQDGHRWRTRGDAGFLAHLPADHTATERVLLDGCRRLG